MSPLRRRIGGLMLVLLFAVSTPIASAAERMRGVAVTEERIALVIGNAAYRVDPLDNPVNDARLMAQSLRQSGFAVALHENLDRRAPFGGPFGEGQTWADRTLIGAAGSQGMQYWTKDITIDPSEHAAPLFVEAAAAAYADKTPRGAPSAAVPKVRASAAST